MKTNLRAINPLLRNCLRKTVKKTVNQFQARSQVSYKSTKNFSDPSYLRYLPLCSEDEFIQFFSKDIKNEILQRIFPRRLRFFSNFVFNKTFSMLKKGVLPYEIPAYFVVLQLFFIGFELFLYFLTIGYVGILFITH